MTHVARGVLIGQGACRLLTLLLLFRHSAKSLNAQDELVATSTRLMKRLHLPHAIVMRLYVLKSNVVILTPETMVTDGI